MVESPASGVSLKDLSPAEFSRVSALLDESIEMAPGDRDAWLTALERSEPKTAAILRALSASQDESRAQRFLEKRDLVARHVASMVEADRGSSASSSPPIACWHCSGTAGWGACGSPSASTDCSHVGWP